MPDTFERALIRLLENHGCWRVRSGKGSHQIWHSPKTGQNFPVPIPTKSRHTANAILKQAGVDAKL